MHLDSITYSCTTWRSCLIGIKRNIVLFKETRLKQQISNNLQHLYITAELMGSASQQAVTVLGGI